MTRRAAILPRPEPRGLRREEAAAYCGVSASHWDKVVAAGQAPFPKDLLGVEIWSRSRLDRWLDGEREAAQGWGDIE